MNEGLEKEKNIILERARDFAYSPWVFFVRKSKLTWLIIAFLLIFGITTISRLPRELNPEVEIPVAVVIAAYPGASPLDVEQQVTDKLESQLSDLEGLKNLTSSSSLGVSSITVEFEAGTDLNDSIRKLKDKVDLAKADLPDDANEPSVIEISLSDQPIVVATLTGADYDLSDLKKYGENLQNRLKGIQYVSDARVIGGRERQIRVDADPAILAEYNLSISQIVAQISASNFDFPIGSVELADSRYSVRMDSRFKTAQELANLQIKNENGVPLYLSDVATVSEGFGQEISISRFSKNSTEASDAVSIQVYKKTGGDITKVAQNATNVIENGRGRDYPDDVEAVVTRDLSVYISESINTLMGNGAQTVILILVLLFVFLGFREAVIAGLSVPFSFFVAFIVMSLLGESLNFLSLFSLVLALGLLVDSAVVIVEGMYEKVAIYRVSGYYSALATIQEYAAPLLSGMLTTIAAFVPLLFVIGIFGEFIKTIPVVVITTLIAALFVSLTIIPAVGAHILNPVEKKEDDNRLLDFGLFKKICKKIGRFCRPKPRNERWANKIFNKFSDQYYNLIPRLVSNKRTRRILIASIWSILAISLIFPATGILKTQSFTQADADYFYVNLEMPSGTILKKTDETAKKVEEIIKQQPEVKNYVANIGSSIGFDFRSGLGGGQQDKASFEVNLVAENEREAKSYEIVERLRPQLQQTVTEGEISFIQEQGGPPSGAAIEARVEGEDLAVIQQLAEEVKAQLETIPTVIDAEISVEQSPGELIFVPNKEILANYGLNSTQVGAELRNGVNRNDTLNIKREGDEIKINVGFNEDRLKVIEGLKDVQISTPTGATVAVSELGEVKFGPALAKINHEDKERIVRISAGTEGGNPTEITNVLKEKIENINFPSDYRLIFGGESQELQEVFMDMFMKMIIGIILILFVLVIQFNSYRQVLIILFTIPLAMIGVIWGMTIARLVVDIPSFVGIVSLAGIVVNNAIILIDQINRELKARKDLVKAIQEAGRTRLRPVLLTTITTVFGLLPLSITQPEWRNMGFTIIFGLTFSTFLTLVIVPTLYASFYKKKWLEN